MVSIPGLRGLGVGCGCFCSFLNLGQGRLQHFITVAREWDHGVSARHKLANLGSMIEAFSPYSPTKMMSAWLVVMNAIWIGISTDARSLISLDAVSWL